MKVTTKQKAGVGAVAMAMIAVVIGVEGGYSNNPKDPGGATNHGVTEAVARANDYTGRMQDMTKEEAAGIYYDKYLVVPGFDLFLPVSPAVTEKLLDSGVNVGPARPVRWLQTALNSVNRDGKDYPDITVDGKLGNATVGAYKSLERARGKYQACVMTIKMLDAQQTMHYIGLTKLETFTPGWVMNRIGNVPLDRCKE